MAEKRFPTPAQLAAGLRRRLFQVPRPVEPLISPEQDALARRLVGQVDDYLAANPPASPKRVLYEPSYYMITYPRLLDVFMTLALRLRGATIVPVLLDPQFSQDFFFGGLYNGQQGAWYTGIEKRLWVDLLRAEPVYLADFYDPADDERAEDLARNTTFENHRGLTVDDYPVGLRAADVVANQNNLASIIDRPDLVDQMRTHVRHIVRQLRAHERLLDSVQPASVFSNVPFYYRWDVAFRAAAGKGIPFYSAMMGERKNTFLFSNDTNAMLDVSPAWESWMKRELPEETDCLLDELIDARIHGKTDSFSPYRKPGLDSDEHGRLRQWRDPGKPLVVFPANVAYDAAAYQASPVFENLPDMVAAVIHYFNEHPEYQLIIKAHPAEQIAHATGSKLFTIAALSNVLGRLDEPLGENIMFLDWDSKIPMADLIPILDLGIVYTSSTAMEMAWAGKPVLSVARTHYSGKGFVIEPESLQEFWGLVGEVLEHGEIESVVRRRIELSRKYYYLYYYHARVDFKLFQGTDVGTTPTSFLFDDYTALLPGKNAALDFICECILEGLPVYGDDRWPPATP